MRPIHFGALLLTATLAACLAAVGCGGGATPTKGPTPRKDADGKGGASGAPTPVASKGWGTLKGKVSIDGMPDVAKLNEALTAEINKNKDKDHCLKGSDDEKSQQTWKVNDGGVADVFVWLKAPEGHFFKIDADNPGLKAVEGKEVTMDQPHCAFIPHALVLFPSYRDPADPTKQKKTGQTFVVKNSAPIAHNTSYKGDAVQNPGANPLIPAGGTFTVELKPSSKPVNFSCSIHGWMRANTFVFDHPYATVSKEGGAYEIPNVPADADVTIMYWHSSMAAPQELEKVKLKEGDNTKDFKITP